MGTMSQRSTPLISSLAVCMLLIPGTFAVVSQKMGNITFECPDDWKLHGPDCYLLVDTPMTYNDATEICSKYGSNLVYIRDEVEATDVGKMVHDHSMMTDRYWIGNVQDDSEKLCEGFWDVGQPKKLQVDKAFFVAADTMGRWREMDKRSRLPFVCRTDACVQGTFRCRDGKKCVSNKWLCDGVYDCDDQSDESACDSMCTYYKYESSGTLSESGAYTAGRTCTWVIEGTDPGQPLSIQFTSLDVEKDVDYVEVWSGGPSLVTSTLQEKLTGQLTNKKVYGVNNFLIVRLVADLSVSGNGFTATWGPDEELSPKDRKITATDSWQDVSSPYSTSDHLPCSYIRQYTVTTDPDSFITLEVMENGVGKGFEYDSNTLSQLGDFGLFPDSFVSRTNTFTFYLVSNGCEGPEKFRARVKKGCSAEFVHANSFVVSPNAPPLPYPPSIKCTYTIRAPSEDQRPFTLNFTFFELADGKDSVKVYDGDSSSSTELSPAGGFTGDSADVIGQALNTSGPVAFVEFSSSLVQTNGFFMLSYNLACPKLTDAANMVLSSTDTQYGTEVSLRCETGFAFEQEEFVKKTEVVIRCDLQGKWNVSRLPSCETIYCGIPEAIENGFIASGSGGAHYGESVEYECFQGFTMQGSNTSTCGDMSMWSDRPTCEASQCPELSDVANGNKTAIVGSGRDFGTIFNFTCDKGYQLIGSQYTLCQSNGTWSHPLPTCRIVTCPVPQVPLATLNESGSVEYGAVVMLTCEGGYVVENTTSDSAGYTCDECGSLMIKPDICVDKNECEDSSPCSDKQVCSNGMGNYTCDCKEGYEDTSGTCKVINRCDKGTSGCSDKCEQDPDDEEYTCSCNAGYTLFTENGTSGRYIPAAETGMTPGDVYHINHTCVPKICDQLGDPSNSLRLSIKTVFDFEDSVMFRCNYGYVLSRSDPITCTDQAGQLKGAFSAEVPTCREMTCDALQATGDVKNIYPNARTKPGDKVLLECNSDATDTLYNKTLYCALDRETDTFKLQGDNPHCPVVDCGNSIAMGGAEYNVTGTNLNDSFIFACKEGFLLQGVSSLGNSTVRCQENGLWDFQNLTCIGDRCTDPGTPGGTNQTFANFEVDGYVEYACLKPGYTPEPARRTCVYDSEAKNASWDGVPPVCKDTEKPSLSNCPDSAVVVQPYQNASSAMDEPTASDNSGLVLSISVTPAWFSLDVPLEPGTETVTYTAKDPDGNTAVCSFPITVQAPGAPPELTCPDVLTLEVNATTAYTFDLSERVSADAGVELSYHPSKEVSVGPRHVGKQAVRVTATDHRGFQSQCAFIVDIKPATCLEDYISSDLQNADVSCIENGNMKCTVTCKSGFAFQSGATSQEYTCTGTNDWMPKLPVMACIDTTPARYLYELKVEYKTPGSIRDCKASITERLQEHVPTVTDHGCKYNDLQNEMTFNVTDTEFFDENLDYVNVRVSLVAREDDITDQEHNACVGILRSCDLCVTKILNITGVSCGTSTVTPEITYDSTNDPPEVGKSCTNGELKSVNGIDMCVQCSPGYYFNEATESCEECVNGQYQDQAGQMMCKDCPDGGQYSLKPRTSSDQCIASCPLGFSNGVGQTDDPDLPCIACPKDAYGDMLYNNCTSCPSGQTTGGTEGATELGACKAKCGQGNYPSSNTTCAPCPRGFYKSSEENIECSACGDSQTTNNVGATNSGECVTVEAAVCQNGGTPDSGNHVAYCACVDGYSGDDCSMTMSACDSSPCYNGGTCTSSGPDSFSCECPSDKQCEMVNNNITFESSNFNYFEKEEGVSLDACEQRCLDNEDCAAMMFYDSEPQDGSGSCYLFNATHYQNGTLLEFWTTKIKSCAKTYLFTGDQCEKDEKNDCTADTCADLNFCRDGVNTADCVCPSDSKYTGPKCETKNDLCNPDPCKNGAKCIDSGGGVRFFCVCKPGFTGTECETDIDECAENPDGCLFGGECTNGENMYTCNCGEYSGEHCQQKPDFCGLRSEFCAQGVSYNDYNVSKCVCICEHPYRNGADGDCEEIDMCETANPCKNNATCSRVSPGVTSCDCPDGYGGSLCQLDLDDCASSPCDNGKCVDSVNDYSCDCIPGFEFNGTNCENTDDCSSNSCVSDNTERCEDMVGRYKCICKEGFTGSDCGTNIDECDSMPCQHDGECLQSSTPGQYQCLCKEGWTGHNCESLQQFCTNNPCQSGATCYSLQDDYFCDCLGGSSGKNCEKSEELCGVINPCSTSSTCKDDLGMTTCQCPEGYTGSSCNLVQDNCGRMPCQNGGTCMPDNLSYTCTCSEGYSGSNCSTAASACDSASCPAGVTCVEVMGEAVCLCGEDKLQSGTSCKEIPNDFDIYFARRGEAVRSSNPFQLSSTTLSVQFWLAPLDDIKSPPVQLTTGNGTNILSVNMSSVVFGDDAPKDFLRLDSSNPDSFQKDSWQRFGVSWNATNFDMYLDGIKLTGGTHAAGFPSMDELITVHIGKEYHGYISQLLVYGREVNYTETLEMYASPKTASKDGLLLGWTPYRRTDNMWARLVTPSKVAPGGTICEPGRADCLAQEPDKEAEKIANCPSDQTKSSTRLVQLNDLPNVPSNKQSNIDGTVVTLGAHRLVYLSQDENNNVDICRFNLYVQRQDANGRRQSCENTAGLDESTLTACGGEGKGRTVQCGNGKAPLSPNLLTCGKLGAYNLRNRNHLPSAVVCGAVSVSKFKVTVQLKYKLPTPSCNPNAALDVSQALKVKVEELNADWNKLCEDDACDTVDTSNVTCDGTTDVIAIIVLNQLPFNLTDVNGRTLTPLEVLQTATLEENPSAFDIPFTNGAVLQKDEVVITSQPFCGEGQGLHDGVCVDCSMGTFFNEKTGMCEFCPIGFYTDTDKQTECKECTTGFTTLQQGATFCNKSCDAGQYLMEMDKCLPCPKNFYNNETGQIFCMPCPAGKATEGEGSTSSDLCYDTCDAGTQLQGQTCELCPRGTYNDGITSEVCEDCPDGNTTEKTGSTSETACYQTACDPGKYRDKANNTCMDCDYGYYQPEKWQDECHKCNESYTTEDKGSMSADDCKFVCEPGTEQLEGNETCSPCKRGYFRGDSVEERFQPCAVCEDESFTTTGEGATSNADCTIRICEEGHYRNETDNKCYECPMGEFQPDRLMDECMSCPGNLTTKAKASTNKSDCVFYCAAGYVVDSAENETCKACERGQYKSNEGDAKFGQCQSCDAAKTTEDMASTSVDSCSLPKCEAGQSIVNNSGKLECNDCPVDTYQTMAAPKLDTICESCPSDKGTKEEKRTSADDCLPVCAPGKQYNVTTSSCEDCPMGFYNTGNSTMRFEQCTACPEGYVTNDEMTGANSIDLCQLRDCPAGQKIDGADCIPCPVGTYQSLPRQPECIPCRPDTNTSDVGSDEEGDCTIYCDAGEEQATTEATECTPCKADYIKENNGVGKCDQCTGNDTANDARTACDVLFCDKGFQYNANGPSCDPCEKGKYKAERNNIAVCQACPTYTTTEGLASISIDDCDKANCAPGFYSPTGDLPCLACMKGEYKETTGNEDCSKCPTDFTTRDMASTSSSQCTVPICPVGQYRDDTDTCVNCTLNTYQNETGQTECKNCPAGYVTLSTGADSEDDCRIVCNPGSYRDDSVNECKKCPRGQYQEASGLTSCDKCQDGYNTSAEESSRSSDCYVICPAGQFAFSTDTCKDCPYGEYQPNADSKACLTCTAGWTTLDVRATSVDMCQPICKAGQYLNTTLRQCLNCPLGSYNSFPGTMTKAYLECETCPEGNTTMNTASDSITDCNITDCMPGSFRSGGGCQDCPIGEYQPQKSQSSCIPCDNGKTTLLVGRSDSKYCVLTCGDGKQYDLATKECEPCPVGFYRDASVAEQTECLQCQDGFTTNNPGQASCIPKAAGAPETVPTSLVNVRVTIVLFVNPCESPEPNINNLGNHIWSFIFKVLRTLDIIFPRVCRNSCDNVAISFLTGGCLENFSRVKRSTPTQEVTIEVQGTESEVENNETKTKHDTGTVIERAFYASQAAEAEYLTQNDISFVEVKNVESSYSPIPGSGLLRIADGTPAGPLSTSDAADSTTYYGPCPNGTYSSSGEECVQCEVNTYQNLKGQTSCKPCPGKTYTSSRGATTESQCGRKCDEENANEKYCSGRGICVYDSSASNGVRCDCDDGFEGDICSARLAKTNDKTTMVSGIAGGAAAFLILLLIIVGIVVFLRRKSKKSSKGSSGSLESRQVKGYEPYPDYNVPTMFDNGVRALPGQPAIMYMNPEMDPEYREFYASDRSTAAPSRYSY